MIYLLNSPIGPLIYVKVNVVLCLCISFCVTLEEVIWIIWMSEVRSMKMLVNKETKRQVWLCLQVNKWLKRIGREKVTQFSYKHDLLRFTVLGAMLFMFVSAFEANWHRIGTNLCDKYDTTRRSLFTPIMDLLLLKKYKEFYFKEYRNLYLLS